MLQHEFHSCVSNMRCLKRLKGKQWNPLTVFTSLYSCADATQKDQLGGRNVPESFGSKLITLTFVLSSGSNMTRLHWASKIEQLNWIFIQKSSFTWRNNLSCITHFVNVCFFNLQKAERLCLISGHHSFLLHHMLELCSLLKLRFIIIIIAAKGTT